jgi:hypothetical protein
MEPLKRRLPLLCMILAAGASLASGAVISLDDAGTDPPLLTPFFSFETDQVGNFNGQFDNQSPTGMDFTFLQLTAVFSPGFFNSPSGPQAPPKGVGSFCDPGNVFLECSVTLDVPDLTVIFNFFGTDATHPGLLFHHMVGVNATGFQPETVYGAAADAPEPAGFAMAAAFFVLLMVVAVRQKFSKLRNQS